MQRNNPKLQTKKTKRINDKEIKPVAEFGMEVDNHSFLSFTEEASL